MNWKLISTNDGGMHVANDKGREFFVYWEQKSSVLEIGVVAAQAMDGGPEPVVRLLTGELDGVTEDTDFPGLIRDPELVQLWQQEVDRED